MKREYTDTEIIFIKEMYLNHPGNWSDIVDKFNKKFKKSKSIDALQKAYERWGSYYEVEELDANIEVLKANRRHQKRNSLLTRHNTKILDYFNEQDDFLNAVNDVVKRAKLSKIPVKKAKQDKSKRNMTMEVLLSDLHYGKFIPASNETDGFNSEIARDRLRKLVNSFIEDFKKESKTFNVHRIIIALIGDIIESYTMHNLESAANCELSNTEQIQLAMDSLFEDVIVPIAKLGVQIDIPAVTGNHDRTEHNKTYTDRGRLNVTWNIYNVLDRLCKATGLTNVKFHIATGLYQTLNIYGSLCMYEHGDEFKSPEKNAIERHMAKRSKQLGHIIDFVRLGHFHEVTMYENGRIIINGCLTGQDSYADHRGFSTKAYQVINYYVEPKTRPTPFFKMFPAYLG